MTNEELVQKLREQGGKGVAAILGKPVDDILRPLAAATAARYKKPALMRGVIHRFPRAMREIAKVSMFGTIKHEVPITDMSYLDVPDANFMYADAEVRHMVTEILEGPVDLSEESRPFHKAQKAWNALADLEVFLRNQENAEPK